MSWTSLDENDATSSSEAEDFDNPDEPTSRINELKENTLIIKGDDGSQLAESNHGYLSQEQLSPRKPLVQEPNSEDNINSREEGASQQKLKNLLASKDARIVALQKLINGQREQLYHFLNMSIKEETLLELKKTCRETEILNRNENLSMALDKFKYDNNLPSEQTLVREDVSRTLLKMERLMRHQVRLVKTMESGEANDGCLDVDESIEISCFQRGDELTDVQKLLKGTKQIQRKMQNLKIQLKKLALIEEERIDLVERVYSMPPDQRQYYAHLAVIEREKMQLKIEIAELSENCKDLKQKCSFLEETEQELNKCIDSKIAGLDLNKIKPGLETHLELMEMVERGELSLIAMTKDEKGKFTDDFVKLYNENAEISERLKDFDKVAKERDDLKRQIEILVESCHRFQREVKALRLASRTDDLLEELRQACLEREQLRTKLEHLTKSDPENSRILKSGETVEKIAEERDQLKAKLTEYLNIEEDAKSLRSKTRQSEAHRVEVGRLKLVIAELEEAKAAQVALLNKDGKNSDLVGPGEEGGNRETLRNVSKQLEHAKELERQRERVVLEAYALMRQEDEIKDLVTIADKLTNQVKILKQNPAVNPAEGSPEGPVITSTLILSLEDEKRLKIIRSRINQDKNSTIKSPALIFPENTRSEKNGFITSVKSFLGLDKFLIKIID